MAIPIYTVLPYCVIILLTGWKIIPHGECMCFLVRLQSALTHKAAQLEEHLPRMQCVMGLNLTQGS